VARRSGGSRDARVPRGTRRSELASCKAGRVREPRAPRSRDRTAHVACAAKGENRIDDAEGNL